MDRKSFIKNSALFGLAMASMPKYSMAAVTGSDKLKVALVGCGSRGTGVLKNMIGADSNIEIVALGDLYSKKIQDCQDGVFKYINKNCRDKINEIWKVTEDTKFIGINAIDKILTTDVDIVALATPPCFRVGHMEKCLNANKNIFAEKPVAIDILQCRKVYDTLIPLATKKNLKVMCGTQKRHDEGIAEAVERIHNGQIGEILSATALRYHGKYPNFMNADKKLAMDDVEYQIQKWLEFIWTSGDQFVEQFIHNFDVALWALNKKPIEVVGAGGRDNSIPYPLGGDRYTNMNVLYKLEDDIIFNAGCKQENGASEFSTIQICGTKGVANLDIKSIQVITGEKPWTSQKSKVMDLEQEHKVLFDAVKTNKKLSSLKDHADTCFAAICGRESSYSGKRAKCDWFMQKSQRRWVPEEIVLAKKEIGLIPNPINYKLI